MIIKEILHQAQLKKVNRIKSKEEMQRRTKRSKSCAINKRKNKPLNSDEERENKKSIRRKTYQKKNY